MKTDISAMHTFVICAYQESEYLEECIQSVLGQTCKSQVIITTATPNEKIQQLADRYQLKIYVNDGKKSLADDWNFAIKCARTELVTLAHQDDVYEEDYSAKIAAAFQKSRNPIMLFTDYSELRGDRTVANNRLLRIKRLMLQPLKIPVFRSSRFVRRRILSLGSAICCPAVTLVKSRMPASLFVNNMRSNIDWQAWEMLSKKKGEFVYVPMPLMKHRIHEGSTTSELLKNSERKAEDIFMFQKFWPKAVAGIIEKVYQKGEKSNSL